MISVFGSKMGNEEIKLVSETLQRQWLGMGSKVDKFETSFQKEKGLNHFLMVNSGSNALYLAVKLLDLPPKSEIILPSFTWVACATSIVLAGHIPVFCDVELETQNVNATLIQQKITARTGAIMVVHYAGRAVEMQAILDLGYPIIEDAAHAVDTYHHGKICGSIGDIGIYSFDAIKNLAVGEGGGITFKNDELLNKAKALRYCGVRKSGFEQAHTTSKDRWWEYDIFESFIKMLPTDISASIGLAQLEKLTESQKQRKEIWDTYQNAFKNYDFIHTPLDVAKGDTHSYFTYLLRVPKRDELAKYLLDQGIYTTLRYHPLHLNRIFKNNDTYPNTEALNQTGLNIPLHPRLSEKEVAFVIQQILHFFELKP